MVEFTWECAFSQNLTLLKIKLHFDTKFRLLAHCVTLAGSINSVSRHGLRNQKLEQKNIAFSESLVLSSMSLYEFL